MNVMKRYRTSARKRITDTHNEVVMAREIGWEAVSGGGWGCVSPLMSGTGHSAVGYPDDLPNRTSTGIRKNRPIGLGKLVVPRRFKIKKHQELAMPSGRETSRARTASIGNANLRWYEFGENWGRVCRVFAQSLSSICAKQIAVTHYKLMNYWWKW
jgi:hypothetical protein